MSYKQEAERMKRENPVTIGEIEAVLELAGQEIDSLNDVAKSYGEKDIEEQASEAEKLLVKVSPLMRSAPELLLALKAVMGAIQVSVPFKDAAIIFIMAEKIIKKAEEPA